jgi:hypothetical protein
LVVIVVQVVVVEASVHAASVSWKLVRTVA